MSSFFFATTRQMQTRKHIFQDDSDGDFAGSYNKASVTSSRIMSSSYINKLSKYYQANVTTMRSENSNNSASKISFKVKISLFV